MEQKMIKQWQDLKAKHPEAVLLFRCGDFYEVYNEDAAECAKILGITLTTHKDGGSMAMFPHYALDSYLPKLVRAGKRVAICDPLPEPPGKETNKRKSETKNSETMKQELKAADLIGKTIFVANTSNKFVIKSYDGDKLMTEFSMDGKQPIPCPLMMSQLRTMVEQGKYIIGEGDAAPASTDEVEEVTDVQPRKPASAPKAEKPKAEKPKAEKSKAEKPKTEKPKTEKPKGGKYTFKTYTRPTSEGGTKTLGRIDGFVEGDELLDRAMADKLHASPMSDRQKDGSKVWWLSFGRRYVEAGRKVCEALNAGKSITELQAIVDAQTSENHAAAEAKRQEREARKNTAAAPKGKTYTEAEVADLIARVIKGDEEAMRIVNDLKAA